MKKKTKFILSGIIFLIAFCITGTGSISFRDLSGSDTYPLDVVAALTDDRKILIVAILNPTESAQLIDMDFAGAKFRKEVKMYQIAVPELSTRNIPGKDPAIVTEEYTLKIVPERIQVAPLSVSLYELELKQD